MSFVPKRGHIYQMYGEDYGTLYCLVVSTVSVPGHEDSCLAVRVNLTTAPHHFPNWVRMNSGDPCAGYVVVHDLDRVDCDELKKEFGSVTSSTMLAVERELKKILGL